MLLVQVVHDNNDERILLYQDVMEPPRKGDYIELIDGRIGYVDQVTWKLFESQRMLNSVEVLVRLANGGQG